MTMLREEIVIAPLAAATLFLFVRLVFAAPCVGEIAP